MTTVAAARADLHVFSRFFMRLLSFVCVACTLIGLMPSSIFAQERGPVTIDQVRVGYLTTAIETQFKAGAWTPVYVDITAGLQGCPKSELVIESIDSDDVRNRYRVALPSLEPGEQYLATAYTRPGGMGAEVMASIVLDGRTIAKKDDTFTAMDAGQQLFVSIGSKVPSLRRALNPNEKDNDEVIKETGRRRVTAIEDVRMMPNQWFAYEPVDLLILPTGNRDFLNALLNERQGSKEALVEWVRRGGNLLVSVGRNQDFVARLDPIAGILPVTLTGTLQRENELRELGAWAGASMRLLTAEGKQAGIEVAKIERKPGKEVDFILPNHEPKPDEALIIVSGAYGLGRVTVVAVDLDQPPFTSWEMESQTKFWKQLLDLNPKRIAPATPVEKQMPNQFAAMPENYQLAAQLERNLEDFEDVPVISFGWVALFILLYILVVGPLDYFFLKKVVKRLELTWITFPTVVITISVVAYFTAYWLKGNDQKINKIDLVDIDLHTQQVYGNSWFTIFSPRIQHYTVGLEPATPGWAAAPPANQTSPPVTVSWMGRPESGWGGSGRQHSQGLFRRTYDYVGEAQALKGVPIQVWSTKSFSASWQAPIDPAHPLITSDLHHPTGDTAGTKVSGTITSHLPATLEDVFIYHHGKWHKLESLLTGGTLRVDKALDDPAGFAMEEWYTQVPTTYSARRPRNTSGSYATNQQPPAENTPQIIKRLLFYKSNDRERNDTLRNLDQTWRLNHNDEVFLVGRVARDEGLAKDMNTSASASSRLWLGSLPGTGEPLPDLQGTLAQETYVRVILPVQKNQ
jgi:hypothetical protein